MQPEWSVEKTKKIYNIHEWSAGFFDISAQGHLLALPTGSPSPHAIDLVTLTKQIQDIGLRLPVLVRFTDILKSRVQAQQRAFTSAMTAANYQGGYTSVYPIKVNQQRHVVEKLLEHGGENFGLEAGSKPELMAVLSLLTQQSRTVICNGYKDRHYIRLALIGQMLGHRVYLIIEKFSELALIFEEAKKLNITPQLGVRIRLASIGKGKWQNTGGEKSKFGLTVNQVLELLNELQSRDLLSCLHVIHFHLGSQIANIRDIQKGLHECARFYVELKKFGANISCVDVGGGLGVDYEGTQSRSFCSMNYTLEEYARAVVHAFAEVCKAENLTHPHLITESGRALTAHHAMLITNLVDVEHATTANITIALDKNAPRILHDLHHSYLQINERNLSEIYHEICANLNDAQEMFNHGTLNLNERATAERLYFLTCAKIQNLLHTPTSRAQHTIAEELNEKLADKYFVNFSLFQSLPDVWAIDQIFPVLPLNKLNLKPTRRGILQDLTCDSDGRIDLYVDGQGVEKTLPLAPFNKDEPYLLGIFLIGAYQEILGDIHNLFGDTDSIHVESDENGHYRLIEPKKGDRIQDVLGFVQFNEQDMIKAYQLQCNQQSLSSQQQQMIMSELQENLSAYTYLNIESIPL